MNQIELIGFIAGGLVAVSLLPQVIRSWRTRSTKDIAISWSIINLIGQILWIAYGIAINSLSLIIMSAISLGMSAFMIILKIRFKKGRERVIYNKYNCLKYMNKKFILSVLNILTLCIVITAVSISFIDNNKWMGLILVILALLCLLSLLPFKIKLKSTLPDIFFGIIDNGILAVLAIFGGHFAGVAGAILGGVVGNAITDGIAGIFEGHMAEKLRSRFVPEERTMLKSAVGKMAGCLLGAGVVLIIANFIKF